MKITLNRKQWAQIGRIAGWGGNNVLSIGPVPSNEDCAQVGSEYYDQLNRMEINAYAKQIARTFQIPQGLTFFRQANPHDLGDYHELALKFATREASDIAYQIEDTGPTEWDEEALTELTKAGYFDILIKQYPDRKEDLELKKRPLKTIEEKFQETI